MGKNYDALKAKLLNHAKSEPLQMVSMIFDRDKAFQLLSNEYFKIIVLFLVLILATFLHRNAIAQTSPYSLSPKWMFGKSAGLDFSTGSPVNLSGNPNQDAGQEATTTICDTSGQIALYSNNSKINDRSNTQLQTVNTNSGQSSTDGGIVVPDPANPISQYYLFTGNDITGGSAQGINWYRISRNTSTGVLTTLSGPNNIATGAQVMEAICAGSDGNGGYWVVSHSQSKEYWAWHIETTGVSSVIKSTSSITGGGSFGSIKINKCQDRIVAYTSPGGAEIYSWNKSTGQTGALIWSGNIGAFGYGCEFSPNGNMAYFTNLNNNKLYHLDIPSGTLTDISAGGSSNNTAEMGTMQLGPDDKIYVTNVSNFATPTYIGVIGNPNNLAASCNYNRTGYTLNPGPGFYPTIYRGIANIAWLNPTSKPYLSYTNTSCGYLFTAGFKNYFNKNITASVVSWNFGDGATGTGSPAFHTYTASGTYMVSVTITDGSCGQTWTSTTTSIVASCPTPAPVRFLNVSAETENGNAIKVYWSTTHEVNNERFDVQRSSNGKDFLTLGKVKSGLGGNSINDYSFVDTKPLAGRNYYRLVQYDFDGSYAYSKVVSEVASGSIYVNISPNPSESEFSVSIGSISDATLEIIDLQGAVVAIYSGIRPGEEQYIGSTLASGIYALRIRADQNTYYEKIIKR